IQIEPDGQDQRLSIFLSIFDVHVSRAPIEGEIESQQYRPGRFLLAFDERASVENEQLALTIANGGRRLRFSLIAGLVARRIVPWKKTGDRVAKGDRIGLIRFGSRVDVYLPAGCKPVVKRGDRVRGGASIIARWE
ncbi:MAG: phosphatidylserine decarboxylase, partial [Acidobacteriota bacterium]